MDAYVESLLLAGEDVRMVASVDSDVYLLEPLEAAIPPRFRRLWAHQELFVMTPGAVVVMSPKGLHDFAQLVQETYAHPDRLSRVVREAGYVISVAAHPELCTDVTVTPCYNATGGGSGVTGLATVQFDDMHLLTHFADAAGGAAVGRGGRYVYSAARSRSVHFEEQMSCVPQHHSTYLDGKAGVLVPRGAGEKASRLPRLYVYGDGLPACYVHFQGVRAMKTRFWRLHAFMQRASMGDTIAFWP